MAERVGVDAAVLGEARRLKAKIVSSTPDYRHITESENEAREVTVQLYKLMRHLSLLKGTSLDDGSLRSYLQNLKSNLPLEARGRIQAGLPALIAATKNGAAASE